MILFSKTPAWSLMCLLLTPKHSHSSPINHNIQTNTTRILLPASTTSSYFPNPSETKVRLEPSNLPSGDKSLSAEASIPTAAFDESKQSRAVEVPSNFFYVTERLQLQCKDFEMFRTGAWKMMTEYREGTNIKQTEFVNFRDGSLDEAGIQRELDGIRRGQLRCKTYCKCDDDGVIVENTASIRRGRPIYCSSEDQIPMRCVALWGCSCTVKLRQPPANIPGASVSDYQRALDAIPQLVQMQHPEYAWVNTPGFSMIGFTNDNGWLNGEDLNALTLSSPDQESLPLEGPSSSGPRTPMGGTPGRGHMHSPSVHEADGDYEMDYGDTISPELNPSDIFTDLYWAEDPGDPHQGHPGSPYPYDPNNDPSYDNGESSNGNHYGYGYGYGYNHGYSSGKGWKRDTIPDPEQTIA
ncbi:hypothetical protein TWF481_001088 [Arthrobotrys musiformis]|uniref:Uncharacterized protein n=1 Tax=Arthrobotrys musiformis TaxID=47236 RepID=A0AAV9WPJ2_9PEZI